MAWSGGSTAVVGLWAAVLLALGGCGEPGGIGGGDGSSSSSGSSTTSGPSSISATSNVDTTAGGSAGSTTGGTTGGTSSGSTSQGSATTTSATGGTTGGGGSSTGSTGTTGGSSSGTTTSGSSSSSSSGGGMGCGNGVVEAGEQCDGADLQGFDCAALGLGGGVLACDPMTCTFDTSMCMPVGNCGNGVIDPGEQCDGADLQGFDCVSLGLGGGVLACDPVMCTFDTSMCMPMGGTSG